MTRHIRFVVLAAVVTAFSIPLTCPPVSARGRTPVRPAPGCQLPRPPVGRREGSSAVRRRAIGPTTTTAITTLHTPTPTTAPGYYGYRGYYGYPGFYPGFYSPYFWGSYGIGFGYGYGYGGYGYGYGYGQYPYPPYYYGPSCDNTGSARLQVTPRNAQVYIDGYFVGVVDNFDGNLQRLNVEAGEHELQLYLEGYRPFTQKVLFSRGGTLKLVHAMQPLGPGESAGLPPKPDESVRRGHRAPRQPSARRRHLGRSGRPNSVPCCCACVRRTPPSSSTARSGALRKERISS